MLRLLTLSGLILLLAAPRASAGVREKILRECQDGRITGDYTPRQIRDARNNIPTDIDEYSDCRDVLARARSPAEPAAAGRRGGGGDGHGGAAGGGRRRDAGGGSRRRPTPTAQALEQAAEAGDIAGEIGPVDPGPPGEPAAPQRPADHAARPARPARRGGLLAGAVRRTPPTPSLAAIRRVLPGRSG